MLQATEHTETTPRSVGGQTQHGEAPVRGMTRVWRCRAVDDGGAAPLLSRVLRSRGLLDPAVAEKFLTPTLKQLHDPSLVPDLDRAAERLLDAARRGESIVIYGDYDVDGISATAILFHVLRTICPAAVIGTYVPHRLEEGYGLNSDAIRELAAGGARVVVTVDCGVTAAEPAETARALGLDLIVTDHHNLPASADDMPKAWAVVHPRLPGSPYPFGELCGAGVAFKLAWRMATLACGSARVSDSLRTLLIEMLGLTSLGVIADVVPLVDENRVIASFGLKYLKHSSIAGLRALVEASGLAGENVEAEDVGFKLAPRLNACGRMGHAREAVELLTTATGARAIEIAEKLSRLNNDRRGTERQIFERAVAMAEAAGMTGMEKRAIVLAHEDWHAGVVGIVCSRLVERFHRPAILLSSRDGVLHGSGRSVEGFSIHDGLTRCAAMLTSFGGHDMAAGLKLDAARLDEFADAFVGEANRAIPPESLVGKAAYDAEAEAEELDVATVAQLRRLSPFGRDNPAVCLRLRNIRMVGHPQLLGAEGRHLSMFVASESSGGPRQRSLRLVGWNWGARISELPVGAPLEALITPKLSTWRGQTKTEAEIVDLRLREKSGC